MIFQSTIDQIDAEISQLLAALEAKKQYQSQLLELDSLTDHTLEGLAAVVSKTAHYAPNAIASLKTAVLELFSTDDGNDGGGNQPTPTPDDDPDEPELLCLNGLTGDCLTTADLDDSDLEPDTQLFVGVCPSGNVHTQESPDNPLADDHVLSSGAELTGQTCAIDPDFHWLQVRPNLEPGDRFWHGAIWSTGTAIEALGNDEYLCQIDGAVGEVTLDRNQLHYFNESLNGQSCDINTNLHWENTAPDGSAWELACPVTFKPIATEDNENKCTQEGEPMPYVELVKATDTIAYQRKTATGEIICTYIGFRTKTIAQSWIEFFEAISSNVELRQAKRMQGFKWEMKVKGLSIGQIDRYAKDCDFAKSYNSTESPAQVAGIEPPSGWQQVQVEREPLTCNLEEGDAVEILSDRHAGYKGHVGTLNLVSRMSELPFSIKFSNGHVRYYPRTELKFIAKGETEASTKPGLRTGQVLMGNRVVTTGAYVGVTRRSRISNARRGTTDKVAAMQLVKDGLDPEQALAVVKGESLDDASDF